ncbi:MAG: Zinc finger MYND domain-containing protein 10 [Marteilia pararefringens]
MIQSSDDHEKIVSRLQTVSLLEIPHTDIWIEQYRSVMRLCELNQSQSSLPKPQAKQIYKTIDQHNKLSILIENLVYMNTWFGKVIQCNQSMISEMPQTDIFKYFSSLYWVNIFRFVDSLVYFVDSNSNDTEYIADLIELCAEKIVVSIQEVKNILEVYNSISRLQDGKINHDLKLKYDIFCSAISTLCTIILNINDHPISISYFCFQKFNALGLLASLLEKSQLFRMQVGNGDNRYVTYSAGGKFELVDEEEKMTLTHLECKIWMSICSAFRSKTFLDYYQSNIDREKELLVRRLMKFDSENLRLQLEPIKALMQHLNQICLSMDSSRVKSNENKLFKTKQGVPLLIEQETELRHRILKELQKNDAEIKSQLVEFFSDPEKLREFATKIASIFEETSETNNARSIERNIKNQGQGDAIKMSGKCSTCFSHTSKRCGRCKSVWYCNRECQVKNWSKHKPQCR